MNASKGGSSSKSQRCLPVNLVGAGADSIVAGTSEVRRATVGAIAAVLPADTDTATAN